MSDRDDLADQFAGWLRTRPAKVQAFAAKYPLLPGDTWDNDGELLWFIGYTEWGDSGVGLIVSPVNPSTDYDGAIAAKRYICPDHCD